MRKPSSFIPGVAVHREQLAGGAVHVLRSWEISKEGSLTAEEAALKLQLVKEEALPLKQLLI